MLGLQHGNGSARLWRVTALLRGMRRHVATGAPAHMGGASSPA